MYEGGSVTVTVTNCNPREESDILAFLRSEGYTCSVDDDVITAECDGRILYEEDAKELAKEICEEDRDCENCDCEDCEYSGCSECVIEVDAERLVGETYYFDASECGESLRSICEREYDSTVDPLDAIDDGRGSEGL